MSGTMDATRETALEAICDHLRKIGGIVGLQEEDILSPAEGSIVVGRTGVSVLWVSRPNRSWQVRERYDIIDPSGERRPVSRLIATVPEEETVRVAKVVLILAFERSLDIEIASL